ncbi:t-SNARE coiled-coil homology domain-containing protein [Haematococcus lacustris]|uniref:t-SNARE coiled-coil homology domain-containing protein n=1 Tax=Haematococcus lacustris TaxID=44745 RepID=A0A699YW20_HAELA|nr:t-SNARE coiled-coil homology domain-containing protein [Haematococcus lacustris]
MPSSEWPETEYELQLAGLFKDLGKLYKKIEKTTNPDKVHNLMKDTTAKLKECKALLKDFEREARIDGMPAPILAQRKKVLVDQLNQLISKKKELAAFAAKDDLLAGAVVPQEENIELMSTQQLMHKGRREIAATDATLDRAERLVEDTLATGTNTAAALGDQTTQLNKIVDDLNDIEFNMKKAAKVITDITRGLLTDKCIGFLLFVAIAGVIAIIVLKVVNPRKQNIADGIDTIDNATGPDAEQPAQRHDQHRGRRCGRCGQQPAVREHHRPTHAVGCPAECRDAAAARRSMSAPAAACSSEARGMWPVCRAHQAHQHSSAPEQLSTKYTSSASASSAAGGSTAAAAGRQGLGRAQPAAAVASNMVWAGKVVDRHCTGSHCTGRLGRSCISGACKHLSPPPVPFSPLPCPPSTPPHRARPSPTQQVVYCPVEAAAG